MSEGKPRNCLLVLGLKASELCLWSIGSSPLFPLCTWHCSGSCSDWNVCASMSPLTFPSSVVRMLCLSFLKPTVVGFMEQRLSTAHPVLTWGFAVFRDVSQFPAVGRTQVANGLSCGCQRCRESSHWTVSACDLFLPRRKDSLSKIFKAFTLFFFFLYCLEKNQRPLGWFHFSSFKQQILSLRFCLIGVSLWLAFIPTECVVLPSHCKHEDWCHLPLFGHTFKGSREGR